jgi:outer membrane protein
VAVAEGELYPTISLLGSVGGRADTEAPGERQTEASIVAKLSVPIYSGGATSARIRQVKELAAQRLLNASLVRDEVRANVRGAWSALTAVRTQIAAAREQISAAERALSGVREESRVGQRTTLDVLNAQQELLNARIALVVAQRDHVVASYSVLAAVGRLSARTLGIRADQYNPDIHYDQVKSKWSGTRAADGR